MLFRSADLGARLNIPALRQVVGPQRPVGLGVERVAPGDDMVERVPEVDDLAGAPALRRLADGGGGRLAVRVVARVPEQGDEALSPGDHLEDLPPEVEGLRRARGGVVRPDTCDSVSSRVPDQLGKYTLPSISFKSTFGVI